MSKDILKPEIASQIPEGCRECPGLKMIIEYAELTREMDKSRLFSFYPLDRLNPLSKIDDLSVMRMTRKKVNDDFESKMLPYMEDCEGTLTNPETEGSLCGHDLREMLGLWASAIAMEEE